ncbi:MAG: hypothetical protein DI582_01920 [Azospirillum brasilense]|nr:MAG: hypothetical protein DI582_01920 [Azospirillum brasilense]
MPSTAPSMPRPTYSQPGFAQLIIGKLQPVQGVKQSDLAAMVLHHFAPVKHKERLSGGDIKLVMQHIQETTERTLNKHYHFSDDAKACAQSVAQAFAAAVQDIVANPQAAEPAAPVRKLEPARPSFPRELTQRPATPAKTVKAPVTLVRNNTPAPAPAPVRAAAAEPRPERAVSRMRPVKKMHGATHAPAGWLGMIDATKPLHTSPNTLRPVWERIVQAAQQAQPDSNHQRHITLDGQEITCMLAGERRKFWYVSPDSITHGVANLLQESKDAAKAARTASYAPRPEKAPRVHTPKNPQPPEGWLGMLGSAKALQTSPALVRAAWLPLCDKAAETDAGSDHVRSVAHGDTTVRMLLGGLHKPSWYMHPDDVAGPLHDTVQQAKQQARRERAPRAASPKPRDRSAPEGWLPLAGAARALQAAPPRVRTLWSEVTALAEAAPRDADGQVSIQLNDTPVRMVLAGEKRRVWYMEPEAVTGVFAELLEGQRKRARNGEKTASSKRSTVPVPEGWLGMIGATKLARTSPDRLRTHWNDLCERATDIAPDAEHVRAVPLGEHSVRMLLGGARKAHWHMHPDDVAGPLKATIDQERSQRRSAHGHAPSPAPARPDAPKGWLHLSGAIHKLGAAHAEVAHVWRPLAQRAERQTPNDQGIVRFEEHEGPVQMFHGGRGKPTWYMEPKSFDTVLAPRFDAWHRTLHPHARIVHTPSSDAASKRPSFALPAKEIHEPSLRLAKPIAAKSSSAAMAAKPAQADAKFEISAVVELALGGLKGHVPGDVVDRLRLETNRAFANYKTSSVVTPGNVKLVADQCRALEKNGNLPGETREAYRAVANALEDAHSKLGHLRPVNMPARSHAQRVQERSAPTTQRGA